MQFLKSILSKYPQPEDDPEARLRSLWDEQGVPREQQDKIIADIVRKSSPGASVGPFTIADDPPRRRQTLA